MRSRGQRCSAQYDRCWDHLQSRALSRPTDPETLCSTAQSRWERLWALGFLGRSWGGALTCGVRSVDDGFAHPIEDDAQPDQNDYDSPDESAAAPGTKAERYERYVRDHDGQEPPELLADGHKVAREGRSFREIAARCKDRGGGIVQASPRRSCHAMCLI
jgi:hypothetical protein